MFFYYFWIACVITCGVIAHEKHLSVVGFAILAFILGPIALLIVALVPKASSASTLIKGQKKVKTLGDARLELTRLKNVAKMLEGRISALEETIASLLPVQPEPDHIQEAALQPETAQLHAGESVPKSEEALEAVFGKYWLNRIGVVLFFLGVSFFIGYTFQYLTAFAKICIGYILSGVFFVWGRHLEKNEKYKKIAWGILGGSWGLIYLSTYATHYIEATRIIETSAVCLFFLALVSFGAILYHLRYSSWVVTAVTYLLAFITIGLGGINYSTLIYSAILTTSLVYLACQRSWHQFFLLGACAKYISYIFWFRPQILDAFLVSRSFTIPIYEFHLLFGILLINWLIFSIPIIVLKADTSERIRYLVGANLVNTGFFTVLGVHEVYRVMPHVSGMIDWRFRFLIALALVHIFCIWVYKQTHRKKLTVSSAGIAATLIAMAIVIRFPRLSISFFWILEVIALFAIGVYYREVAYRVLGSVLGSLVFLRILIVDCWSNQYHHFLGMDIKHSSLILIFSSLCYLALGALAVKKPVKERIGEFEGTMLRAAAVMGAILLTWMFADEVPDAWRAFFWSLEGMLLLGAGFLIKDKVFRVCALCVFSLACFHLFAYDLEGINTVYRIIAFMFLGAVLLGASFVYSKLIVHQE